jgi:hypothetical protein
MPNVMRRALVAVLLAAACQPVVAASASAAPGSGARAHAAVAPALEYTGPAATISRGDPLTFAVRTAAPAGSVVVRVAGALQTDADGLLTGPDGTWLDEVATPVADGVLGWTVPRTSVLRQRPGQYYWQGYAQGDGEQIVGPVQKLVVTLPAADRGRGSLYPRFGRKGASAFLLSSANLPLNVSRGRLRTLARSTAARWGLRASRWTIAVAGMRDGRSVAGFSPDVPAGVLGVETDFLRDGRVVERDLALSTEQSWAAGPGYPGLDQIDLESVLLHELGHMAGNKRHRARCANSPMIEALGAGEWWRGARDHWFEDCSAFARVAVAGEPFGRAVTGGRLVHRIVRVG